MNNFVLALYLFVPFGRIVANKCSNVCSTQDEDLDCFYETRNYFKEQALSALNNLLGVEYMIDKWKRLHENNGTDYGFLNKSIEINETLLWENDDMSSVLETIVLKIAEKTLQEGNSHLRFTCPLPGDYLNTLWIYLFTCSCIILALTLVLVAVHSHKLQGEMKRMRLLS